MHPLLHRHHNRAIGAARLRATIAATVATRIDRSAAAAQVSAALGAETAAALAADSDLAVTAVRAGDQEGARGGMMARVLAPADPVTEAGMTGIVDRPLMSHSWMIRILTEVVDTMTAAPGLAAPMTGTGAAVEWDLAGRARSPACKSPGARGFCCLYHRQNRTLPYRRYDE